MESTAAFESMRKFVSVIRATVSKTYCASEIIGGFNGLCMKWFPKASWTMKEHFCSAKVRSSWGKSVSVLMFKNAIKTCFKQRNFVRRSYIYSRLMIVVFPYIRVALVPLDPSSVSYCSCRYRLFEKQLSVIKPLSKHTFEKERSHPFVFIRGQQSKYLVYS